MSRYAKFTSQTRVLGAGRMNYMLDAADIVHGQSNTEGQGPSGFIRQLGQVTVDVENNTGTDIFAFCILGIKESIGMESEEEGSDENLTYGVRFSGNVPSGSDDETIVVTLDSAANGDTVSAIIMGPVPCLVDIQNISHRYAVPIADDPLRLQSAESGSIRLVVSPAETGEKFVHVLLGSPSAGGTSTPHQYAVVMEAIKAPADPTADADDAGFFGSMGTIRIEGKSYKDQNGDPIPFDKCACRDLAGQSEAYPEKLLPGTQIEIVHGGQYPNPDYDPDDEESTEPEFLDWYVAVNTEGVYTGILAAELSGTDRETTIQVKDTGGNLETFSVFSYYLGQYQKIESGTGVMVARQTTESGRRLVVVKSRSAITQTDTT